MSPSVLDREEVTVEHLQKLPDGGTARVIPSNEFGNVALDPDFTGSASQGAFAPYFSQLDNLRDMVAIRNSYAPSPVAGRLVFVSFHHAASALRGVSAVEVPAGVVEVRQPLGGYVSLSEPTVASNEERGEPSLGQATLAEAAKQMRDLVDLPVQDVARMAGIGRRQYYNILRGKATSMRSSADERRFHLLNEFLGQLYERLGDPRAVRSAVLMPLESSDFRSFVELAAESGEKMPDAYQALVEALDAGRTSRRRRLPPTGTMSADDPRWAEAAEYLREYRSPTHE